MQILFDSRWRCLMKKTDVCDAYFEFDFFSCSAHYGILLLIMICAYMTARHLFRLKNQKK